MPTPVMIHHGTTRSLSGLQETGAGKAWSSPAMRAPRCGDGAIVVRSFSMRHQISEPGDQSRPKRPFARGDFASPSLDAGGEQRR